MYKISSNDVGDSDPVLGQTEKVGGVKPINGIPDFLFFLTMQCV